jgi:hypothetical protein
VGVIILPAVRNLKRHLDVEEFGGEGQLAGDVDIRVATRKKRTE